MNIAFNYRDHRGEIEIVFKVVVKRSSPIEKSEVEILDVCVNGQFVPRKLEDEFINMVGLGSIEEQAVMKYMAEVA